MKNKTTQGLGNKNLLSFPVLGGGGGPRSLFADKVGVAEAWHGCGLGAVYDNDLIFL